jgi:hypothetical protein
MRWARELEAVEVTVGVVRPAMHSLES